MPAISLLRSLAPAGAEESVDTLLSRPGARLERIVSHGHHSPPGFWYEQTEDEWVMVLAGQARLALEEPDELVTLMPGDSVYLAAGRRHRVEWTCDSEPTIWLALFLPPAAPH